MFYGSTVVSPTGFSPRDGDPWLMLLKLRAVIEAGWVQNGSDQRADWTANLIAVIPIGLLTALALRVRGWLVMRLASAMLAVGICVAWVLAVKYVQLYFPRTVTLNYITAQSIGGLIGVCIALIGQGFISRMLNALRREDVVALRAVMVLAAFYVVLFTLEPFDFVLSAGDLHMQIDTLTHSLLAMPSPERPLWMRPMLSLMGGLVMMPVGMAVWLSLLLRGERPKFAAVFWRGACVVIAVWAASLMILSAKPSLFTLPMRLLGMSAGAWALAVLTPTRFLALQSLIRRAVPFAILPYLLLLVAVNGLLSPGWRTIDEALGAVDARFYLPLWTHYIVTKAQAAKSVAVHLVMFAPIGAMLWGGRSRISAGRQVVALLIGFNLALAVEIGRWLKPGLLPDLNDAEIGAFAAWAALMVLPRLWSMLGSVVGINPPRTHVLAQRAQPTPPYEAAFPPLSSRHRAGSDVMVSGLAALLTVAMLIVWPVWNVPLSGGVLLYAAALWRCPALWLILLPAITPLLDLSVFSGWWLLGEQDIFVLATIAVLMLREPPCWPALSRGTAVILAIFIASLAIATLHGALGVPPPGGSDLVYASPWNAWREAKPVAEALLLLPFLSASLQRPNGPRRLLAGMILLAAGIAASVVIEREVFTGLWERAIDFRVVGTFASMHVGGGHIGAALALSLPFVIAGLAGRLWWLAGLALLPTLYALAVTFARTAYAAGLGAAAITGLVLLLTTKRAAALRGLVLPLLAACGLMAGIVAAALDTPFMAERLSTIAPDFAFRAANWQSGLRLHSKTALAWAFGMGEGSFPSRSINAASATDGPSYFRIERAETPSHATLIMHAPFYFGQRLPFAANGETLTLSLNTRAQNSGAQLFVNLCEKQLAYSFDCVGQAIPVGSAWQPASAALKAPNSGKPLDISFSAPAGSVIDLADLHLRDAAGRDFLVNGDFADGVAHWLVTDDHHWLWRIFDQYLMTLFEAGALGLLSWLLLIAASIRGAWMSQSALGAAIIGGAVALLINALFDAVLEAPRLALLYDLLLLAGLVMPSLPTRDPSPEPHAAEHSPPP